MCPEALPVPVSDIEYRSNLSKLTLREVEEWINKYRGLQGRFELLETFARRSELYNRVIKPLLSIETSGSIEVERRVKPMKNEILTKQRNRLSDEKAAILLRASQNLRYLAEAKSAMKQAIANS